MIGLLMMLAASGQTYESFMSGNALLSLCETNKTACTTYIGGVADFLNLMESRGKLPQEACVPPEADLSQETDVVIKALRDKPASRHEGAAGLVAVAIADAFPCPNR